MYTYDFAWAHTQTHTHEHDTCELFAFSMRVPCHMRCHGRVAHSMVFVFSWGQSCRVHKTKAPYAEMGKTRTTGREIGGESNYNLFFCDSEWHTSSPNSTLSIAKENRSPSSLCVCASVSAFVMLESFLMVFFSPLMFFFCSASLSLLMCGIRCRSRRYATPKPNTKTAFGVGLATDTID